MLRGAIDHWTRERIAGWILDESGAVSGRRVLAFLGRECVGAGSVDIRRPDLAQVGTSGEFQGFNFAISIPKDIAAERVTVRLENSDFCLLNDHAAVAVASEVQRSDASLLLKPERIEWMRQKGWLEQAELDFLRSLSQFCVYDFTLRKTRAQETADSPKLFDARQTAKQMFELLYQRNVVLAELKMELIEGLKEVRKISRSWDPVVAVLSESQQQVDVLEGLRAVSEREYLGQKWVGAVEYPCGPDRLLFLDIRGFARLEGARTLRDDIYLFYAES